MFLPMSKLRIVQTVSVRRNKQLLRPEISLDTAGLRRGSISDLLFTDQNRAGIRWQRAWRGSEEQISQLIDWCFKFSSEKSEYWKDYPDINIHINNTKRFTMFQLISDKVKINEGSYVETINTKYFVVCHERPQSEGQYTTPGGGEGRRGEESSGACPATLTTFLQVRGVRTPPSFPHRIIFIFSFFF